MAMAIVSDVKRSGPFHEQCPVAMRDEAGRPIRGSAVKNRFFAMDVTGDGRGDWVIRHADGVFTIFPGTDTGVSAPIEFDSVVLSDVSRFNENGRLIAMDWDGDRDDDLIARYSDGRLEFWASNHTGFVSTSVVPSRLSDANGWSRENAIFAIDAGNSTHSPLLSNSDEILLRYPNGTFEVVVPPLLFTAFTTTNTPYSDTTSLGWATGSRLLTGDLSGDGRDDLLARWPEGGASVHVMGAQGFPNLQSWSTGSPSLPSAIWGAHWRFQCTPWRGASGADLIARRPDGSLEVYDAITNAWSNAPLSFDPRLVR